MSTAVAAPGKGLIWAAVGPAAVGLALGLTRAEGPGLLAAALLPAVVGGVLALTSPALYITAAFAGVAPEPRVLFGHLHRALRDGGLIMAGLAPGLLFLAATTRTDGVAVFLGMATVALGALVGLRLLFGRLFAGDPEDGRGLALFVPWALVSLGIGAFMLRAVLLG
ncbi:MAG: hypothetical protein KC613_26595 [Myxococcales bacterium]|nr:hypothetical protein [Myxococcales bacterium]MCB9523789.1 hypothetical protein [Myxococcales bacterium]